MADTDYPVEISPPDIAPYRAGNTGVEYVTTFDSGKPGPHVAVTALVHGNELCGAVALDFLLRAKQRPSKGRLTLAFCNIAAFLSFDKTHPSASRFVDEDFNRVWSPERLDGRARSVELVRARALRPVIDNADFLLDIHSMQHPTPPLMMCGPLEKGRKFARAIGMPALVVSDAGHAAGRRMRDYAGFGDVRSPKNALLVECGQHWEKSSVTVAKEIMLRFLGHFGMLDPGFLAEHLPKTRPPAQTVIEVTDAVTIRSDQFTFAGDYLGLEVIAKRGTEIARDGDQPILTPYDNCILIMPSRRLSKGQTAVRLGRYIS
ncbi:MAG: succinylglutamate desuccinylase/aspartoacylase family protein [Rhodospirillales bacterium]|nr:succinylglutamate desuccinylase/aspartoacylase family protein [Rhodospirillales bacterium]